jgi:hypothetical protein
VTVGGPVPYQPGGVKMAIGAPAAVRVVAFSYQPIPHGIRDLWRARDWKPSDRTGLTGTQANSVVNLTYAHLSEQLLAYMGGPPFVSNWFTYGKWASREAGQGIKNLSAAASAMKDLIPSEVEAALLLARAAVQGVGKALEAYVLTHAAQFKVLAQVMADDSGGMVLQVLHLFFTALELQFPTAAAVLDPIWQAEFVWALLTHRKVVFDIFDKMVALLRALIHGNQGIYRNMAAATDVFLRGESDGADEGPVKLDAWSKAAPGHPDDLSPRDPQEFLRRSFDLYRQCRKLWIDSLSAADPRPLLARRRQLAHLANVTIGCQEQMLILQSPAVFSHPVVQGIVSGQEGVMRLHDPLGGRRTIQLLPAPPGGNWADFMVRMGVEPGSGPISVRVANPYPAPPGARFTTPIAATDYVPRASRAGTIYQYFEENLDDGASGSAQTALMTQGMTGIWENQDLYPPRPLEPL